jgi:hypothetical protein
MTIFQIHWKNEQTGNEGYSTTEYSSKEEVDKIVKRLNEDNTWPIGYIFDVVESEVVKTK